MSAGPHRDAPLRVGSGLLFHETSEFNVGGYVSYSARILRALDRDRTLEVIRLHEPDPLVRPQPEITAPHLVPYSAAVERLIEQLARTLRRARIDVCHAMEWGAVGTALFEACLRAHVPYSVVVIDHKPVCAQSMLLYARREVCDGPASPHRCAACLHQSFSIRRPPRPELLALRLAALSYYYRRASSVIAFTPQHADEVARWLGRPREAIDVVPIAVPPPDEGYRKDAGAFARPLRIGFIARAVPEWGIDLALEAWRRVAPDPRDAVLEVYTSKEFVEERHDEAVADLVAAGSVRVSLEPVFDRLDDVHAPLAAMVVASQWKNNISGAGLEGLLRGTPVITSDRHAFYESLSPAMQGLAYRFGDAGSLAEVLARVIRDPAELAARSADAPPAWTEDDHVAGVADVLRRTAATPTGPAPATSLGADIDVAALVARGAWTAVLDAYLAGRVEAPAGGVVVIAPFVDAPAVEEAVLARLEAAGLTPETCPPLAIVEALDVDAAVAAASALLCGPDGHGLEAARALHLPVTTVAAGVAVAGR